MGFTKWVTNQWDRAIAIGVAILGALAIILGWYGLSGKALPSEQIPYLASGAVFGLFLLGVGATLWLSADLRDEWRKLDQISSEIHDVLAERDGGEPGSTVRGDTEFGGGHETYNGEGASAEKHQVR